MSTYTVQALNLKIHSLGESDKIVTLFSLEKGLLRAVAKGAKKTTGKLTSRTDLFQYNELYLSSGKSLELITQARLIYGFPQLRKDLKKIYIASYWTELLLNTLGEKEPQPELFQLFLDGLRYLEMVESPEALFLCFELKLLDFAGYKPHLASCGTCGATEISGSFFFNPDSGILLCGFCQQKVSGGAYHLPLSSQAVHFINRLAHASIQVASRLKISRGLFDEARRFTSSHLQCHLAGRYRSCSLMESFL